MKKTLSFLLVFTLLLAIGVPAFASGTVTITVSEVSCTANTVSFSGTASGVKAAVAVRVYDGSSILAMESYPVSKGAFSGEITGLALENGKTYTLKAADYDGGSWVTKDFRFTLTGTASISGNAVFGETLTASLTGGNTVSGEALSYVWKRGSTEVGATASYTLVSADVGNTLTVTISGDKHQGNVTSTATSAIAKAEGSVTAPTAKTGLTYTGSALSLINAGSSTTGTVLYKLGVDGTYGTAVPTAENAGSYTVYYKVQGNANYKDVAEANFAVTIAKAEGSVTAPTAKTGLTYTGSALSLINAGSSTTGTVLYKLGVDGTYGTELPTAVNAGTYQVLYKVTGDENHNDVSESSIYVSIAKRNIVQDITPTPEESKKTDIFEGVVGVQSGSNLIIEEFDLSDTVSFPVSLKVDDPDVKNVELPAKLMTELTEISSTASVDFEFSNATISLDSTTLKAIADLVNSADGQQVSFSLEVGDDAKEALSKDQLETVNSMANSKVINASIDVGDEPIHDLCGGSVEIKVDYQWDGAGVLRAACIDETGDLEAVEAKVTDPSQNEVSMFLKHFSSYVIYTEEALPFADVTDPMEYYYDAVKWALVEKITTGVDDTHFAPLSSCTRAQMVTFLWRTVGSPVVNYAMSFTDVAEDSWYAEAVRWAASEGITNGTGGGKFSPNQEIDRAQIVTMLYRYSKAPAFANMTANGPAPSPYEDVSNKAYYYNAVLWATAQGITEGTSETTFSPDEVCKRAEIVTFLYRMLG